LTKSASISFRILRLALSYTVGSALLTIINELSCQFVIIHLLVASLSAVGFNQKVIEGARII
jgi:hypothetical protein